MEITSGKIISPQKVIIYGPEGIGKSTLAAQFPNPLFSDVENSTKNMDVRRLPRPTSWQMLLDQAVYVREHPELCGTYVIDTADWAERLCIQHICAKAMVDGLEGFGYGKGYTYLEEEFGRLLNLLEEVITAGVNVVMTAHATQRKVEQPDEIGSYDHWEMKLQKKTAPLVKEWGDIVLFARYKVYVVNVDNKGAEKGKNKAQGGARVMQTSHHPCWDAKNRFGLASEVPMEFTAIAHCIPVKPAGPVAAAPPPAPTPTTTEPAPPPVAPPAAEQTTLAPEIPPPPPKSTEPLPEGVTQPLWDLMQQHDVTVSEIQKAVAFKGYFPAGTPIANYGMDFINGVLIGAWPQVCGIISQIRLAEADGAVLIPDSDDLPF